MAFRKDDMIDEINLKAGTLDWYTRNKKLLDKSVSEVVIIEKYLNDTFFKLERNEKFQLVFTHETSSFKRVAVGDIEMVNYFDGIRIQLSWNLKESFMKIADTTLEQNYFICMAENIS